MAIEGSGNDFGSNLGKDLGKDFNKSANKVADRLHNAVDSATDRASDMAARARTSLDGWIRDLGAQMERHPIATIFIGFGAGYILAKFRGRRV